MIKWLSQTFRLLKDHLRFSNGCDSHQQHLLGQQINASIFFGLQSISHTNRHRMVSSASNHSIGRNILCCTWHIELSTHYLLNWKQFNPTIYHQWLLLLLGSEQVWNLPKFRQHLLLLLESSTGLEEYHLHSKQQSPLFLIFDNKSCSILHHLPYSIMIRHTCSYIWGNWFDQS